MKYLVILSIIWITSDCSKILAGRKGIIKYDIIEGETLTLTCKADPTHIRTYRWVYIRETQKPKVRVLSSGRRLVVGEPRFSINAERQGEHVNIVLKLKEIRPYETGLFMCWKQNQKPEPQVYVKVLEVGFTETEPKSVEISGPKYTSFGNHASIKCIIRPKFTGKILWSKDEISIPEVDHDYKQSTSQSDSGETVASLEILTAREDGNYTCKTDADPPMTASFHLIVTVAKVETLSVEPPKEDIHYKDTVTFTCVVSGTQEEILWMKDRSFIRANETEGEIIERKSTLINGNKKSELIVTSFSIGDNGQYVCYVPGDSKYVLVNIEGRPPRMVGEITWEYLPGSVLQFSCSIQYTKGKKMLSWLFDEAELPDYWYFREITHEETKNITTFLLDISVTAGNLAKYIGMYTCSTSSANSSTFIHELVPLIIGDPPPERIEVEEGELLSLHCSIFGYIAPMVYWEKFMENNWKMLEETAAEGSIETLGVEINTEFLQFDNNTMGEHQELIIRKIRPKHAGQYQCKGTNDRDTVMLSTQVGVIALLPRVIGMTAAEVTEGQDMIITCSVENWKHFVQFKNNLTIIDPEKNPRYSIVLADSKQIDISSNSFEVNTFRLTIANATIYDQGIYECYAGNDSSDSVKATVNPIPPEIIEIASSPPFENSELFISCTVQNMPLDEELIFHRENQNLNYSQDGRYSVHSAEVAGERVINLQRIATQATFVLKINSLQLTDSGAYDCMLGPNYKDVMATIFIDVEEVDNGDGILIEISPSYDGKDIILQCTVTKWKGEVTFFHNDTILSEEEERFEIIKEITDNSTSHRLRIIDWSHRNAGRYRCFTTPFAYADVNITSKELAEMFPHPVLTSLDFKQIIQLPTEAGSPKLSLRCLTPGEPQETFFTHNGVIFAKSDLITGDIVRSRATLIHLEPQNGYQGGLQLTINAINSDDLGYWHCTSRYPKSNIVLNASLTVELYVPAKFIEVPDREMKVIPGSTASLTCEAYGLPVLQVDWFKKGFSEVIQSGKEHATLEIVTFSPSDEGSYQCRASNEYELLEYETRLSLDSKLRIIEMSPAEVIVNYGDEVDLTCIATGSISPTVEWFKNTADEGSILQRGQDFATFSIKNVTVKDIGVYTCRATILGSVVSQRTKLALPLESKVFSTTINAPTLLMGRLVHLMGPSEVEVGDDFTITCLVSPLLDLYVAIISYKEFIVTVGDDLVSNDLRLRLKSGYGGMGERLYKLTIHTSRETDTGNYECQVNTKPLARHVHRVNVVPKGMLTEHTGVSDDSFLITPELTEENFPSMPTEPSTRNISMQTPRTSESNLTMKTVGVDTEHNVVHNDVIPAIIERIGPIFASIGDTVKIPCTTTSLKTPIIWFEERSQKILFVDGLDIRQNSRFKLEGSLMEEMQGKTNTLVIEDAQLEDSGNYSCSIPYNDTTTTSIELFIIGLADVTTEYLNETDGDEISKEIETATEEYHKMESTSVPLYTTIKLVVNESIVFDVANNVPHVVENGAEYQQTFDEIKTDQSDDSSKENDKQIASIEADDIKDEKGSKEYPDEHFASQDMDGNLIEVQKNFKLKIENETDLEDGHYSESDEKGYDGDIELQETESIEAESKEDISEGNEEQEIDNMQVSIISETDRHYDGDDKFDNATKEVEERDREHIESDIDIHFQKNVTSNISSILSIINKTEIPTINGFVEISTDGEASHEIYKNQLEIADISYPGIYEAGVTQSIEVVTKYIPNLYEGSISTDSGHIPISEVDSEFRIQTSTEGYKDESGIIKTTYYVTSTEISTQASVIQSYNESDVNEPTITTINPETLPTSEDYKISDVGGKSTGKYEHHLLIATPGEDIVISEETEVLMSCPTEAVNEDITWKSEDKLLFLGNLDLAGVDGIQLTLEGQLRLLTGYPEIKSFATYTCFVYDYDNYQDVEVMSYKVNLINEVVVTPVEAPFHGPGWYSAVVAPNSRYSSQILSEILQDKDIITRSVATANCSFSSYVEGWENAQIFLKNCVTELKSLTQYQSVFVMLDVQVSIPFGGKYATYLIYVHNEVENVSAHIYGTLTPIISDRNFTDIVCGTPIYEHDERNRDLKNLCKETIEKSIPILKDSYNSNIHPVT